MSAISIPRTTRHHGATGKTLAPTLAVGTKARVPSVLNPGSFFDSTIGRVRRKRKYGRRYCLGDVSWCLWVRRDQFTVIGGAV